jgi:hypothetical protein
MQSAVVKDKSIIKTKSPKTQEEIYKLRNQQDKQIVRRKQLRKFQRDFYT